jgi:hypothetical protein
MEFVRLLKSALLQPLTLRRVNRRVDGRIPPRATAHAVDNGPQKG